MQHIGESYTTARRNTLNPDTSIAAGSRAFLDDRCANCLAPLPEEVEGLFCSDWCGETTKHVRYFRRVFRDGRIDNPDVQEAVRTRLAFLPSGGYKVLGRTLSPQARAEVKERDHGLCKTCGKAGADIDHISGSSGDLSNLQLLCADCHRAKTEKNMVSASEELTALIDVLFADRVFPETPNLLADDEQNWESTWRKLKTARKQRCLDELEELDIDIAGLKTRAEWIEARDDVLSGLADDLSEVDPDGPLGDDDGGFGLNSYFARSMLKND